MYYLLNYFLIEIEKNSQFQTCIEHLWDTVTTQTATSVFSSILIRFSFGSFLAK